MYFSALLNTTYLRGESGGKVTSGGGHVIGHCEKNISTRMCLILNDNWDKAVWIYKYKRIMNGNEERLITYRYFYFNFNILFKWQISYT